MNKKAVIHCLSTGYVDTKQQILKQLNRLFTIHRLVHKSTIHTHIAVWIVGFLGDSYPPLSTANFTCKGYSPCKKTYPLFIHELSPGFHHIIHTLCGLRKRQWINMWIKGRVPHYKPIRALLSVNNSYSRHSIHPIKPQNRVGCKSKGLTEKPGLALQRG